MATLQELQELESRAARAGLRAPSPTIAELEALEERARNARPAITPGQAALGALDVGAAIASGAIAEPIAGLAGIGKSLVAGLPAGGEAIDNVREALTFQPRTEQGQAALQSIGGALEPVGEFFEEAGRQTGELGATIARNTLGGVEGGAADNAGFVAGASVPTIAGAILGGGFLRKSPVKERIKRKIEEGSTDNDVAGFMLNGRGKIKSDPLAKEAIRQGVDEGVVAAIKGSTREDRANMLKMLDIRDKGLKNARFKSEFRASDAMGESIKSRVQHLKTVNKKAGRELDGVANDLKGQFVDISEPVGSFRDSLESMGIRIRPDNTLDFSISDLEGLGAVQGILRRTVARMRDTKTPDAHDVHRMKKFIDEQVNFGKTGDGLSGKVEGVLKGLRHDLDTLLDTNFDEYNRVNTTFSETRGALDGFQDAAGRKVDLTGPNADKQIGVVARRLLSNVQSRAALMDALDGLSGTAQRYGGRFDDDLFVQAMFVDELDALFGAQARTSLQGDVQKAAETAAQGSAGMFSAGASKVGELLERARGINNDGAIAALRALLTDPPRRRGRAETPASPGTDVVVRPGTDVATRPPERPPTTLPARR